MQFYFQRSTTMGIFNSRPVNRQECYLARQDIRFSQALTGRQQGVRQTIICHSSWLEMSELGD